MLKGRVYDDARQPGGERRSSFEAPHSGERLEIGVLHRVLRFGVIPQHTPSRAIETLIVASGDYAHGRGVALGHEPCKLNIAQVLIVQQELGHVATSLVVNAVLRQSLGMLLMAFE